MSVISKVILLAAALMLTGFSPGAEAQGGAEEQKPAKQRPPVRRVVRVEHQSAERLASMVGGIVSVRFDKYLSAIVLTGDKDSVDEAEEIIESLDEPRAPEPDNTIGNVELTIYLLGAVAEGGDDFSESRLAPVIEQLRSQLGPRGYRLLDSLLLRGRGGGQLHVQGGIPDGTRDDESRVEYEFETQAVAVAEDERYKVFFRSLSIDVIRRTNAGMTNLAEIRTRLEVPTDKLVVVGKAGVDDPLMEGLFVVLSARVVE